MAIAEAAKEVFWLKGLTSEMTIKQCGVMLYYNSQSTIYLAKNQIYRARYRSEVS